MTITPSPCASRAVSDMCVQSEAHCAINPLGASAAARVASVASDPKEKRLRREWRPQHPILRLPAIASNRNTRSHGFQCKDKNIQTVVSKLNVLVLQRHNAGRKTAGKMTSTSGLRGVTSPASRICLGQQIIAGFIVSAG